MMSYPFIIGAIGAAFCVLSVLCIALTVVWRFRNFRDLAHWKRTKQKWESVLAQTTRGMPENLPSIESGLERHELLFLWCEFRSTVRGESAQLLNKLATRLSLDDYCSELLCRRMISNPYLAIVALGFMGSKRAYDAIQKYVDLKDPVLSFVAARALTQIDPERAIIWLLPKMAQRNDWHGARLLILFKDAGPYILAKHLPIYILENDEPASARLIPYLQDLPSEKLVPVVTRIFSTSQIDCVRLACKALLSVYDDATFLKRFAEKNAMVHESEKFGPISHGEPLAQEREDPA